MSKQSQTLSNTIEMLELGESHVRLERVPLEGATDEAIKESLARVRNGQNQVANRLRKSGKGDYRVETVSALAPDRQSIFCMAVTTRVEEEDIGI